MKKCTLLVMAMAFTATVGSATDLKLASVASNGLPMKRQCSLSQRICMSGEGVMALKKAKKQASAVTDGSVKTEKVVK